MGVKGDVYVAGNSVFGKADTESYLEIHSLVEGRFPLSLAEATNPKAHVTIRSLPPPPAPPSSPVCPRGLVSKLLAAHSPLRSVPDPTGDSYIHLPDASGTIITTGSLPAKILKSTLCNAVLK